MIYLLRHGETIWNREGRLQGQGDSPLTLRGIEQARALGRCLAREIDDPAAFSLVASPLGRCWQTAAIVAETLGLDTGAIAFEPRLMEHAFGDWEGLTKPEIKARDPDSWRARAADKWNVPVPGGESHGMVSARVARWLEEQDRDSRLIVVSHGMAGRALRACYAGLPGDAITGLTEDHAQVFRLADGKIASFDAGGY